MKTKTITRKNTRSSPAVLNSRSEELVKQSVMSENTTYSISPLSLRNMEDSPGNAQHQEDILLYDHKFRGETEELGSRPYYRLFFLLEGKMFLSGERYGVNIIGSKELTLLPPGVWILAGGILDSRYAVLNCDRLDTPANAAFMRQLREHYNGYYSGYENFSLRETLERQLWELTAGRKDRFSGRTAWENVFAVMRSSYTVEEMVLFFYPMLS